MPLQQIGKLCGWPVIGKQILYRGKTIGGGGLESLEKGVLRVEERKVCRET